jgi:hypothetical protein
MATKFLFMLLLLDYTTLSAMSQTVVEPNAALIKDVISRAALLETYIDHCGNRAPETVERNREAYAAWKERNQWEAISSWMAKSGKFQTDFEQERQSAQRDISSRPGLANALCRMLPQLIVRPDMDPSVRNGAELKRFAAHVGGEETASTSPSPARAAPKPTAPAPPSAPVQAGELTFTPSPGWTIRRSSDDKVTLERFTKRDRSIITILSKLAPAGVPLAEAFTRALRNEIPSVEWVFKDMKSGKTANGFSAAYFEESYKDRRIPSFGRATGVAFDLGERMQMALLMSEEDRKGFNARKLELEEMVRTFRFPNVKSATTWDPSKPPKGAGGLEGLYWGHRLLLLPNVFGGMDTDVELIHYIFFPNGQFYMGLPEEGRVLEIDFAEALTKQPKRCGIYKIEGNNLIIEKLSDFGVIEVKVAPFKRQDAKSITFELPPPMKRNYPVGNLRLNGRYSFSYHSSGATPFASISAGKNSYIEFTPDGRYRKSGFKSASFSQAGSSGTIYAPQGIESGRYTISGFRLTLAPDNGAPEHLTLIVDEQPPNPKVLFINDMAFILK